MKGEQYISLIQQAAALTGIPFWLLWAQMQQESDFDAQAKSPAGAIGLMQIMPATARGCGVDPATLWAPEANIRLGARILADAVAMWRKESPEERLKFGLAAYNGGAAYIINAQATASGKGLDPSLWQSIREVLPGVTAYVDGEWRKPDYRQIIDYVDTIWAHYTEVRDQPIPSAGENA